jgi:hypothetical protein
LSLFRLLSLKGRKYYNWETLVRRQPFGGKHGLRLDHFDGYKTANAGVVTCGAEEVGFGLVDDPFANRVLMGMYDPVHQEARLVVTDPEGAAAVLPKLIFLQSPEGFTGFFEALKHPFPAKVHFHFNGFQECRGGIFLKVPFEISGCGSVLCPEDEVEMAAHEAPGIKLKALALGEVVKGIGDDLFISGPCEQINLVYYVECQEITRVKRENRLFI